MSPFSLQEKGVGDELKTKRYGEFMNKQYLTGILISILLLSGCGKEAKNDTGTLAVEMQRSLKTELLDAWYPVTLDTVYGGFLSNFTYDWKADGPQNKMLVTQARHVWTASQAAVFFKDPRYKTIAEHGFRFLKNKMWDPAYGGFYMMRNREGGSVENLYRDEKRIYGIAFAIYALASYYEMSKDTAALNLAKETFYWMDAHSRDPEYGGYFNHLTREGDWFYKTNKESDVYEIGPAAFKDYNSSIHILEAFTALYKIWPDTLVWQRLLEMFRLIRDTFTREEGYLQLFWRRDWTPVTFRDSTEAIRQKNYGLEHVSFGHDVETGYLLLEAAEVLQIGPDSITMVIAKKLVDHSLAKGWDKEKGGFYYEGSYVTNSDSVIIINNSKSWWVQAEGLNALLLMATLFPEEDKYYRLFEQQWQYIKEYLIDHEYGGWYTSGLDISPNAKHAAKASDWKVDYHDSRALMNCINYLRSFKE